MKQFKILFSIIVIPLFFSCAGVSEKWTGIKFGKNHTPTVSATHQYSLKLVDAATLSALDQMEIIIIDVDPSPDGNSIKAVTLDHDIFIKLKSVNQSSTLMQIDINLTKNGDHATTANEIMNQTEKYLINFSQIDTTNLAEGFDLDKESLPIK